MNKKFLVMGAGRSGVAVSNLLLKYGACVELYDDLQEDKLAYFNNSNLARLTHKNFKTSLGRIPELKNFDTLVLSPGIPTEHFIIKKAHELELVITSEIDCAYNFLAHTKIIGITGTNGKSTTTTMIENILRSANKKVVAGGNLGTAFSELVLKAVTNSYDYIILELSSFQLEHIKNLKLDCAVLLNITPDHLDRHQSFKDYQDTKLKIFSCTKPSGFNIINKNLKNIINPVNFYFFGDELLDLELQGSHNYENARAAFCVAQKLHINHENILKGLASYKPLPHRCELVAVKKGVSYINDSKGTTVIAVSKALSLSNKAVYLLLGGQAKGEDFSMIKPEYFPHIKAYFIFGQAKHEIYRALNTPIAYLCENLSEAFGRAHLQAQEGEVVLLSPGCASYDQFNDYTERGELFRTLVEKL